MPNDNQKIMRVTSAPPAATPRRRRRWRIYAALPLLLVIGAPAAYYLYTAWSLENAVAAAMAETTRIDPRWRLDDIEADRRVYDAEKNSALHIAKVVVLLGNAAPTNHRDYQDAFEGLQPWHQLTAQQIDIITAAFENMNDGLLEARKLKDLPGGRYPMKWAPDFISTPLAGQQDARQVFDVLQHDAMLRAQHGDPDQALESCMALVNAARSLGDEPLLISFLIRAAGDAMALGQVERVLAQGFPSAKALAEMQRRLAQESDDLRGHWRNAMRGERAGHHHLYEAIAADNVKASFVVGMGARTSLAERFLDQFPAIITKDYPNHLRHMNELVAAAQLPAEEQLDALKKLEEQTRKAGPFTRLLTPATLKVAQAHLRIQAHLAATQAALASERFRLDEKRWPDSLAELVKAGKLEAAPTDPMDGNPLRFRRLPDGAVIYSIGPDRKDNQGAILPWDRLEPGGDWGVRLWNPTRRRQPPRAPGPEPIVAP